MGDTARNDITGARIMTGAASQRYLDNYELLKASKPSDTTQKPLEGASKEPQQDCSNN